VTLLYMMRRKDLGIPADDNGTSADSLATEYAPAIANGPLLLEIVHALPWNIVGVGERLVDDERARRGPLSPTLREFWRSQLASQWRQSETAAYTYLSLTCNVRSTEPSETAAVKNAFATSPLIQYRWATCQTAGDSTLRQLIADNSRFHEARYVLGQRAQAARRFGDAERDLVDAWRGIPHFTAAATVAAELELVGENYSSALELSDSVLATVPDHWRATLAKLRALSGQSRSQEAIALASRMIAAGQWYVGDAYYWRAWNEYQVEQWDPALVDVEAVAGYETTLRMYVLGALVRMKKEQWREAHQQLLLARRENGNACDVQFYLGHTESQLGTWIEAARSFADAVQCYVSLEGALQRQIAAAAAPAADEWTLRQVQIWRRELAAAVEQRQSAVYDAAVGFTNAKLLDDARVYATQAQTVPAYEERARVLLALIGRDRN
jgi:tetratricopeptide (TPR) repeat protein